MKVSRRAFLATSAAAGAGGALVIGLRMHGLLHMTGGDDSLSDAWVRIYPDDRAELVLAKTEMGQGVYTALPMVLAEEADLDWSKVSVVQSEESTGTGGSGSVRGSYLPLRRAGAQIRILMIATAARRWNVPEAECRARNSHVAHRSSGRTLSYGRLVDDAQRLPIPDASKVQLKSPEQFTLLGRSLPHLDIPDKVSGRARFGLDVRPQGLVYAVVARSSKLGGTLRDFDAADALKTPGVLKVFDFKTKAGVRYVAVVAKTTWAAMRGREALKVNWNPASHIVESTDTLASRCHASFGKPPEWRWPTQHSKTPQYGKLAEIESVYEYPFLSHAPIEPMNTTVHLRGDGCEVWSPTQDCAGTQKAIATELGLPESKVKVHVTFVGGGFGSRFNKVYWIQAAQIARQVHVPVQLVWTREDTMVNDEFRQFGAQKLRGAVDAAGNIVSWNCHIVDTSLTGPWGMPPQAWESPVLDPFLYPVSTLQYSYTQIPSPILRGAWRSVSESFNGFIVESFTDELAHATHADPYMFRRRLLLSATRNADASSKAHAEGLLRVLDLAAAQANWTTPLSKGRGRGIACWAAYNSFISLVAEVTADKDSFRVDRVIAAVDCGQILNANGFRAQIEGGITFGLSAAMGEEITVNLGAIQQQNFDRYQILRMPNAPPIEIHSVQSHREPGGLGELGVILAAPVIANAYFAATEKRLRKLPLNISENS